VRIPDPTNSIEQQSHILRLLRRHGPQTRRQLADLTGHSLSLIRQLMQNLEARDLVREGGIVFAEAPGRPSQVWSLTPDACLAIGVDIGGVSTRIAVLDALGNVLAQQTIQTAHAASSAALLHDIGGLAAGAMRRLGERQSAVRGVGIAFSGFVDFEHGRSLDAPNIPHAHALPLQQHLVETLGLPVLVDDSSRAMALAELRYGAARGFDNFVCVNVGAGVGTGIIVNGQLFRGALGLAGEIGHIPVMVNGPRCRCGRQGCLETLASGSAIAAQARYVLESDIPTRMRDHWTGDLASVNAESVMRAALDGDDLALKLIDDAGQWLGVGVAILINLFSPDLVVLTGGVMRHNTLLSEVVQREADQHILAQLPRPFPIRLTSLDEYAGALGAATLILDREFESGFAERLALNT
jgi:glucokinase-like ROK family protein